MVMRHKNELFSKEEIHLSALIIEENPTDIYEAVSRCTRCGYCLENCPTYIITKDERLSPRGRNRVVRLLIEGTLKDLQIASKSLDSCLLCSACSDICYGNVATAEIVLEAKREKRKPTEIFIIKLILKLREKTKIFDLILKTLYLLYKLKLPKIADKLMLFELLGFPTLSQISRKLFNPPLRFLHQDLANKDNTPHKPNWIYFLSCGTDYLFPNVGKASIKVLERIYGSGIWMKNDCCGLIAYNYGELKDAKAQAIRNIEKYLSLKERFGDFFIVLDCSSCAAFLKKYPQLLYNTDYYEKAVEFASKVKDIIELIKPQDIKTIPSNLKESKVTLHLSCKAYNEEKLKKEQEKVLEEAFKENFIKLKEVICCGGAGAYTFTNPQYSDEILKRKIRAISNTHANYTLVSSTSCLIQLGYGAQNLYPSTTIIHYIEFIEMITREN